MKWILHIIISLSIFYPSLSSATAIAYPSQNVSIAIQDTEAVKKQKKKPKKKWKKWLKDNIGLLLYGAFLAGSIFLLLLGIIRKVKWMWILGLTGIFGPLIFGILLALLILIFRRRPHPLPYVPIEEKPEETQKESKK